MPCSICGGIGHNRRTCLLRNNEQVNDNIIHEPVNNEPVNNEPVNNEPVNDNIIHEPVNNEPVNDNLDYNIDLEYTEKYITFRNMKNENYLIYCVLGSNLIMDLDSNENEIQYITTLLAKSDFKIRTWNGYRYYLVPYPLTTEPSYHPLTDKTFIIPPYVTINIYPEISEDIYIDDKDKLSELNKWKFNALKLDYLIKEIIKLGGMNYDSLEPILDLHQDIQLDYHDEYEKDRAGIPSAFSNVT